MTMVLLGGWDMTDPARLGLAVVMLSRRRPMLDLFAFCGGTGGGRVGIALAKKQVRAISPWRPYKAWCP